MTIIIVENSMLISMSIGSFKHTTGISTLGLSELISSSTSIPSSIIINKAYITSETSWNWCVIRKSGSYEKSQKLVGAVMRVSQTWGQTNSLHRLLGNSWQDAVIVSWGFTIRLGKRTTCEANFHHMWIVINVPPDVRDRNCKRRLCWCLLQFK